MGDRRVPTPCRRLSERRCSFPESRPESAACPTTIRSPPPSWCCAASPTSRRHPSCPARPSRRDARPVAGCTSRGERSRRGGAVVVDDDSDARTRLRLRGRRSRRPADVPRRRRRPREAAGPGEGAGHGAPHAGHRVARGGCPGAACVPPRRRGHARRGRSRSRSWSTAALPGAGLVLFFDEPALVSWQRGDEPLDRESAIDVLSGALAAVDCVTGVHVCGDGDVALGAGSGSRGARRRGERRSRPAHRVARPLPRRRRLDRVGRGARPTGRSGNRPIRTGARSRACWCELTRRGCDPVPLRTRGLITPACGLAGYGASQAERVLGIARELAARVHDQAVAARLTLGA